MANRMILRHGRIRPRSFSFDLRRWSPNVRASVKIRYSSQVFSPDMPSEKAGFRAKGIRAAIALLGGAKLELQLSGEALQVTEGEDDNEVEAPANGRDLHRSRSRHITQKRGFALPSGPYRRRSCNLTNSQMEGASHLKNLRTVLLLPVTPSFS